MKTYRKRNTDYSGQVFSKLSVLSEGEPHIRPDGKKERKVICKCVCGKTDSYLLRNLLRGRTRSCGCHRTESASYHRLSKTKTYWAWAAMLKRGRGIVEKVLYYDRGIRVCERWLKFKNFLEDMGEAPKGTSIDRIDNDGNYEAGNCRWTTWDVQNRNRRNNVFLTFEGETLCITDTAKKYSVCERALRARLRLGWSVKQALTTPVRSRK